VVYAAGGADAPLSESLVADYDRKGYLVLENFLSEQMVGCLQNELSRLRCLSEYEKGPEWICERGSGELRSLFRVHQISDVFRQLANDRRLVDIARYLLADDVYVYQSRLNYKPGLHGREFYWHSDFETWHVEDGMPRMRALSCSLFLTDNDAKNGALMLMPGSHKEYLSCVGETPKDHYLQSLKQQTFGIPDDDSLKHLANKYGIACAEAKAGSVLFFDCNTLHGSNSNITPDPRSNLFFVYNHIDNKVTDPFCAQPPRPEFIATRKNMTAL
jgi:ectoine hydroxylase